MNILMLNYEFPPLGGGAGRATRYISRELVNMGCKVDVLTSCDAPQPLYEVLDGVRVYRVPTRRKSIHECGLRAALQYVTYGYMKMKELVAKNNYDITHSFFSLPTGILSYLAKRRYNLPYILSLRGSDVPGYDPYGVERLHRVLISFNVKIWQSADRVIALSRGLANLAHQSAPNIPMKVIYNGIDTCIFRPVKVNNNGRISLITVSRLLQRKGIHFLIEALHRMKRDDLNLLIVGKGNYEEALKEQAYRLNLQDKITFYGYCPNENLPYLYAQADIFVLPSLTESFGIVFAEAMACGLPIIGTTVGGIPEVVIDRENGILVPPRDVEALLQAIRQLSDNSQLRAKMRQNNIRRIADCFSWETVSSQYLSEYISIF